MQQNIGVTPCSSEKSGSISKVNFKLRMDLRNGPENDKRTIESIKSIDTDQVRTRLGELDLDLEV